MLDPDKLAQAAAAVAVGALATAAAAPVVAAGKAVWGWLRGKLSGTDAAIADAVEAAPDKPSAATKLTGVLQDLLHDRPDLAAELRELLERHGAPAGAVVQTATTTGHGNQTAQVAGQGNKVTLGKG